MFGCILKFEEYFGSTSLRPLQIDPPKYSSKRKLKDFLIFLVGIGYFKINS
jgi:hypothetical protein